MQRFTLVRHPQKSWHPVSECGVDSGSAGFGFCSQQYGGTHSFASTFARLFVDTFESNFEPVLECILERALVCIFGRALECIFERIFERTFDHVLCFGAAFEDAADDTIVDSNEDPFEGASESH